MENNITDEYLVDLINRFANLPRIYQQRFLKRIEAVTKKEPPSNIKPKE